MVKEIVKDVEILKIKSTPVVEGDEQVIADLLETAMANAERCHGLAAIQIGEAKRVIVMATGEGTYRAYINPMIIKRSQSRFNAREGCLSLEGSRFVMRHTDISLGYEYPLGKKHVIKLSGLQAQIIQHEVDHCNGVLI